MVHVERYRVGCGYQFWLPVVIKSRDGTILAKLCSTIEFICGMAVGLRNGDASLYMLGIFFDTNSISFKNLMGTATEYTQGEFNGSDQQDSVTINYENKIYICRNANRMFIDGYERGREYRNIR